jgi:hypothetical protein
MEFISKLRLEMERLEREYEARGTVTWAQFKADPAAHQKKVVELQASDFASGTLRIMQPCKLKLKQDVQFNPNRGTFLTDPQTGAKTLDPARTMDWFPLASQTEYQSADVRLAYSLGFFAAIAIEAEGVILDLNNYTISQHAEHALMQQFYASVELSDQPFPVNSGPANFGSDLRRAKKTWIKNGTLGYSSHQSLHGNDSQEILVTNVVFRDSTVAGVSLNGSKKVALIDCEFKGHRKDVKVRGAFNEIRLDAKLVEGYKAMKGGVISAELQAAYDAAKLAVEKIFNDVIFGPGTIQDASLSADDLAVLKNQTGLSDAIAYGFVLNTGDNATGKFLETRDLKGNEAAEIAVIRCNIEAVIAKPIEILAMSPAIVESQEIEAAGEVLYDVNAQQRGMTGAVLDFMQVFDYSGTPETNPNFGAWKGNVVADMQAELAAAQTAETNPALKAMLGQINIEPMFIKMKRSEDGAEHYRFVPIAAAEPAVAAEGDKVYLLVDSSSKTDSEHLPLGDLVADEARGLDELEFVVLAQGDIQHHVLKGNLGLRAEGISDLLLEKVTIAGVSNEGELGYGYTAEGQEMGYIGDLDGGHGGQGSMAGYFGNHARGVSIAGCSGVTIKDLRVSGVSTKTGPAWGIELKGETTDVSMERVEVKSVSAAPAMTKVEVKALKKYPNWKPTAVGLRIDESVSYTEIKGLKITSLSQPVESAKAAEIESTSVKIS